MSAIVFDYGDISPKVETALRDEFEKDTIELSEGYKGRVHVLVVSSRFNGMSERQKQDYVWEILRAELKEDAQAVSVVLCYGTEELR